MFMNKSTKLTIDYHSLTIELLPERAIYIPRHSSLVIGDVHIGKTTDMQREGIRIPDAVASRNIERLVELLLKVEARRCYFLGDLFHARTNREFPLFEKLVKRFNSTEFILIKGNHEFMKDHVYEGMGLKVITDETLSGVMLRHHPITDEVQPSISAHIHPKLRLRGRGRQTLVCPAFVHQGSCLVIPAFGELTGGHFMDIDKARATYVIAEEEVIAL